MKFEFDKRDNPTLESLVYQAIGAAFVCREPMDCTGVFNNTQVEEIASALMVEIGKALEAEAILRQLYFLHLKHFGATDHWWDDYAQEWKERHVRVDNYEEWKEVWERAKKVLDA